MITPQTAAILQGTNEGQNAAESILPSSFQTTGKAQATNPFDGIVSTMVLQINQIVYAIGQEGDRFREDKEKFIKIAYDLTKANNSLTDKIVGKGEKASG